MPDAHDRLVALIDETVTTDELERRRGGHHLRAIADALVDPANRATVLEAMGAVRARVPVKWDIFGFLVTDTPLYVFPTEDCGEHG